MMPLLDEMKVTQSGPLLPPCVEGNVGTAVEKIVTK